MWQAKTGELSKETDQGDSAEDCRSARTETGELSERTE
jgi:hypothetical protein